MGARSLLAGAGDAALHRQDGLAPRDPAGDAAELAWVAERLEVEQHEVRPLLLFPPLEQVVRRHVGLVADRDEAREAEAAGDRLFQERQPERAALRGEADRARR